MLVSSLIWTIVQLLIFVYPDLTSYKLKRLAKIDLQNRMVSFLHGLICIFLCSYLTLTESSSCESQSTQSEYIILMMSTVYFTYDFLSMAYFGLLDLDMTVHHLLCISGLVVTLY